MTSGIWFVLFTITANLSAAVIARSSVLPNIPCNDSNEGMSELHSTLQCYIWICRNGTWTPYRIDGSVIGSNASLSANTCKHIKTTSCSSKQPSSGVYWVSRKEPMQVYCDMSIDGGGWTLVWKHSYMEALPPFTNMYYFSDYYKNCTTYDSGWCNIPNKKRFNPTEQRIVAYHKGAIVYAYKGIFNYNIDHDWTGGVLVDFTKIVDKCTVAKSKNVLPAPSTQSKDRDMLGLAFDKYTPCDYFVNCDTIYGTWNSPVDCRWENCYGSGQPGAQQHTQQTVAIYVC